jgi:hypothetical protein
MFHKSQSHVGFPPYANHVKYERLSYLENDQVESMWFKICPTNEQPFLLCFVVWYDKFENEVSNAFVQNFFSDNTS